MITSSLTRIPASKRAVAHLRTREIILQRLPQRLPTNGQVAKRRAGHVQERRRDGVGDELQGGRQRGPDTR
jgi:hypothetical protein